MRRGVVGAFGLLVVFLGPTFVSTSVIAQASVCTMPDTGRYSVGALVRNRGQAYQCVRVYDDNLALRGVAWIKVSPMPDGSDVFLPQ